MPGHWNGKRQRRPVSGVCGGGGGGGGVIGVTDLMGKLQYITGKNSMSLAILQLTIQDKSQEEHLHSSNGNTRHCHTQDLNINHSIHGVILFYSLYCSVADTQG